MSIFNFLRRNWFWGSVTVLSLIKLRFSDFLPLFAFYNGGSLDDLLLVRITDLLIKLMWPNDLFAVSKGIGFSLFLIVGLVTGLGYATLNSLCYVSSCLFAVFALKPVCDKKWFMLLAFALLLFMPVSFAGETFQRLYRNSITAWQVILIIGSLAAMLFRLEESPLSLLTWALPGALGLSWLYHTREDAVWCIPFVFGMLLTSVFFLFFHFSWKNRSFWFRVLSLLTPLLWLVLTIEIISAFNYFNHGFWGTTFFQCRHFRRMVQVIYSIDLPEQDGLPAAVRSRIAVKRRVMRELYPHSPTLNRFKQNIEKNLDQWSQWQNSSYKAKHPDYREVENGWIFWSMLQWFPGSVKDYRKYCRKTAREINTAIRQGHFKTRPVMPSALMAPWNDAAYPILMNSMTKILKQTLTNQGFYMVKGPSSDNLHGLRYMENFSGKKFPHANDLRTPCQNFQEKAVHLADWIIKIYERLSIPILIWGGIGFIVLIVETIRHPQEKFFQILIFLLGLIATYFVLVFGVAYTDTTGFDAIRTGYLAGCYPLIMIFILTAGISVFQFSGFQLWRKLSLSKQN